MGFPVTGIATTGGDGREYFNGTAMSNMNIMNIVALCKVTG